MQVAERTTEFRYTGEDQRRIHNFIINRNAKRRNPPTIGEVRRRFSGKHPVGSDRSQPIHREEIARAIRGLVEARKITPNLEVILERPVTGWSESEIAKIKEGIAEGLSASKIAATLPGRSRGSVIGVCSRRGIALSGAKPKTIEKIAKAPKKRVYRPGVKAAPQTWEAEPVPEWCTPRPFVDLEPGQCKFCVDPHDAPITAYMNCCSAPVVDKDSLGMRASYCEYHYEKSVERKNG